MVRRKTTIIKRWKQFLEIASGEVTFLNHYAEVRAQFNLIASQSPVANVGSEFWTFVTQAFAHEMIFRISRLTEGQFKDRKGRVLKHLEVSSLTALLEEFAEHPEYLSRAQYLGVSPVTFEEYLRKHPSRFDPPDRYNYDRLNREFDDLAGKGANHIAAAVIQSDLATLGKVTKRLKAYRNKRLAHLSVKRGRFRNPKMTEITRAITEIDRFMRKYFLALNCASHPLEFGHVDITDIFLKPWIKNENNQKELQRRFEKARERQRKKRS
ncbi:MAG: hypothetical protein KF802_14645 [Bdellovibrionaceae bacterium]|nr:hypothetical protein [Pseudobdellovibrionaceae bacterium]